MIKSGTKLTSDSAKMATSINTSSATMRIPSDTNGQADMSIFESRMSVGMLTFMILFAKEATGYGPTIGGNPAPAVRNS